MSNTKITIYTLTVDKTDTIPLIFNSAMTRVPAAINDLANNDSPMVMNNRDTYELMYNLINEYYINWEKAIEFLLNDAINSSHTQLLSFILLLCYYCFTVIVIVIFLKLLSNFSLDREKPINLFLTLKKQVFENLKASAENFSNKILNKFFGNEDNEEESQLDYQANIKPNDINIIKFKALNGYNFSLKKSCSFFSYIIIIVIFLLVNVLYSIIKTLDYSQRLENINQFITLFDKNNNAQIDFILSVDIFKSYLFNNSIPILNKNETEKEFIYNFLTLSNKFEQSIILISKTSSFLGGEYLEKYSRYLHGDFSEILNKEFYESRKQILARKVENGLKPVETRVFEILRYFTLKYFNTSMEKNELSPILMESDFKLYEIHIIIQNIIRVWYKTVLELMIESFYDFQNKSKLIYYIIYLFINFCYSILFYCLEDL